MKLTSVRVHNFRSIVDSEEVEICDRVTVLVGKNEQGKTTFLRALASLNQKDRYSPSDLPNHLRAVLEEKPAAEIPIIKAWLRPEAYEKKLLAHILADWGQSQELCVTRYYGGNYSYSYRNAEGTEIEVRFALPDTSASVEALKKSVETLQARLTSHAARLPAFAPSSIQAGVLIQQLIVGNFNDATTMMRPPLETCFRLSLPP